MKCSECGCGSFGANENCGYCSAYAAGRRSAFRWIARWARKAESPLVNIDAAYNNGLRDVAREAESRARGAS